MFIGNMVTEAIPARVYSLYKISISKKDITRTEVQRQMEPPGIYEGDSSYFSAILKAATELKLVEVQDNIVVPLISKEQIKDIDDFRLHVISKIDTLHQLHERIHREHHKAAFRLGYGNGRLRSDHERRRRLGRCVQEARQGPSGFVPGGETGRSQAFHAGAFRAFPQRERGRDVLRGAPVHHAGERQGILRRLRHLRVRRRHS